MDNDIKERIRQTLRKKRFEVYTILQGDPTSTELEICKNIQEDIYLLRDIQNYVDPL